MHSIHSPMYNDIFWGRSGPQSVINIAETLKSKRMAMVDEVKRALDIAEIIPFRYMVQHLGVGEEEFDEPKAEAAFSSLVQLSLLARHRRLASVLENIPNDL